MTHTEELSKIAARLAEIAKDMAENKTPSKICAIGEEKMILGVKYTKQKERDLHSCTGCAFNSMCTPCPNNGGDARKAVVWRCRMQWHHLEAGAQVTAHTFRLAFSSWLAIGGDPLASASVVARWWRK